MVTKIMSISLGLFLLCSNQLKCEEKPTLQQIICSGNNVTNTDIQLCSDTEIELTGFHNCLEFNVSPSVKNIVIKTGGNHNTVMVHMPIFGEMPEVTCSTGDSNHAKVIIYSFKDVKTNYADNGHMNSCRVVFPWRKCIIPAVVVGGLAGVMIWDDSRKK